MKRSPSWLLLLSALMFCAAPVMSAQSADAAAEEVPEGVIDGMPIERGDGRWLGLTMVGPKLQLNFYDAKKHPEKVDRVRAVLRIDPVGKETIRDVMNPTDAGTALICNKPIRAPWVFKVYITLISPEEVADSVIVVDFNRSAIGGGESAD